MTIYGLDTFLSQFWNSQLFHVWFYRTSWTVYRFLRRQVRWSDIPISKNFPQFFVILTVKGFSIVNESEVDVFLEFSCFFLWSSRYWQFDLWSSAFSKLSLYIWTFSLHILLKPDLKDLEHYLASLHVKWVLLNIFGIVLFLGIGMKTDFFLVLWPLLSFPNLLTYWVQHFHSSIFYNFK